MSREHERTIRRVDRGPRALLASLLLSLSPQVPSLVNSLMSVLEPARTSAAELYKPQEQAPILQADINEDIVQVIQAVEKGDLGKFLSFFSNSEFGVSWSNAARPREETLKKAELQRRLAPLVVKSPSCVGIRWDGRAIQYPSLVFKTGDEYFRTWLSSDHSEMRNTLTMVEIIPANLAKNVLKDLEPCPKSDPVKNEPEILNPLPRGLSGRIAFSSGTKKNNNGFYTDVGFYSTDLTDFRPARFADAGHSGEKLLWSKDGVVVFERNHEVFSFDTKNGQEKKLIAKKVDGDKPFLLECPSIDPKTGRVIISFIFGANDQDIYSISETGSKEQITRDSLEISETCGAISSDGKHLAFSRSISGSHDPKKTGLVIADYKGSTIDISREPIFIEGPVMPLEWSLQENKLLALKHGDKGNGGTDTKLIFIDAEKGTFFYVVNGASGATFSPDGKYILYSKNSDNSGALYLYSLDKLESVNIIRTPFPIWNLSWEKENKKKPERKTIAIVPGLGSSIKNGQLEGALIDNLLERALDSGYLGTDIVIPSLGGWRFTENGFYMPKDQDCEDVLRGEDINGIYISEFLKEHAKYRPNNEIILITHSLGSIRTLTGLSELLRNNPNYDFSRLTLITTHGPNLGIDKLGLDYIFASASLLNMPKDCQTIFGLPFPSVINYPALSELKTMWQNRKLTIQLRRELVETLKQKGAKVYALGNFQDCVMDATTCLSEEYLTEIRVLLRPNSLVSLTQELPGAINIMRHMGRQSLLRILRPFFDIGIGHSTYWDTGEGLDILTAIIGDQIKKDN